MKAAQAAAKTRHGAAEVGRCSRGATTSATVVPTARPPNAASDTATDTSSWYSASTSKPPAR